MVVVLSDDDGFWKGVAIGGGIVGLIVAPIVAIWLHSKIRRNEEHISKLENSLNNRISVFKRTYYEDRKQIAEEYRFLCDEIRNIKSTALTHTEKDRLLSHLNEVYREKLYR